MTILGTLLGRGDGGPARASIESPLVPLTSTTLVDLLAGPQAHAGVRVTETTALGMPAVWRAVTLISGTAAALPLHAYEREGRRRTRLEGRDPASELLADPHPDMTPFELWQLAYASICLWGNAYFLKLNDRTGRLAELWWVAPHRVKAGRADDGTKVYVLDGKQDEPRTDATILHIPGFGYDGVCGVSPVRTAREGIGLALAAEQFGARLFGNGSLATGLLQTEQRLNQEQATELKKLWKAGGTGLESAHDVRVLGSGAKWQQLTIPPEDAQFIESRRFQIGEVARMFGVPPHLLMDVERSTSWGTGIEEQTLGWLTFGLMNWLRPVEQRLTKLLRRPNTSTYVRYSLEGLLRGDSDKRASFYRKLWEIGVLSTNDIRELEDLDPVEGGDVRYRPLNMGELGQPDPEQGAPAVAPPATDDELEEDRVDA